MINDIYINIYPSVGMVLFYGLWFTISLFPSKLLNFGEKEKYKKHDDNYKYMYIFDPPLYTKEKNFYCPIANWVLYILSYGSVLMKEMQK